MYRPTNTVLSTYYVVLDESFLLSNVRLLDHPVVYCSSGFTQLTGWSRHDVLRRSSTCSMMHGPLTDKDAVARLRHALQSDTATEPFEIVLYSNNGQFYWHNCLKSVQFLLRVVIIQSRLRCTLYVLVRCTLL